MTQEVSTLWKEYVEHKSSKVKERLITYYQPLVKYVANGFQIKGSSVLEWDDLVSAGTVGLLEALDRFDPSRNIKFNTYATFRIRGAIMDILREVDWAPRKVRGNVKLAYKTIANLQGELGRNPTEEEVADRLNISLDEYHRILESMYSDRFVSLQDIVFGKKENEYKREQFIENQMDKSDQEQQDLQEVQDKLNKALKELPSKERLVLTLYYYEGLNLADIAAVLNVTESRVCQIHAQSLLYVKVELTGKAD